MVNVNEDVAISVDNVRKSFRTRSKCLEVLRNVSMDLKCWEIGVIMGPTGVGKTTLLKIVYGLLPPDEGSITINGVDIYAMPDRARDKFMLEFVGYMPQEDRLFETLNVEENLVLPLLAVGLPEKLALKRVKEALNLTGLDNLAKHFPKELSMGQRRKILFLRALINEPTVLLLDEPTAHMDSESVEWLLNYLKYLREEKMIAILLTSHDYKSLKIADRVFWLSDGILRSLEKKRFRLYPI